MNRLLLLTLLLAVAPAGAQPVPDTTAPARYFPLEVGNVWEYRGEGFFEGYQRRAVVGDTVADGVPFFRYRVEHFALDGAPAGPAVERLVRIDPATHALRTPGGDPLELAELHLTTCALDAPFFDELFTCPGSAVVLSSGGPDTVMVGDDAVPTSLKYFDDNSREVLGWYAADVGLVGVLMRTGQVTLEYARVGGVVYGAPVPVAAAPAPGAPSALRLGASPNPAGRTVTLALELTAPGLVSVEVFDAVGRRVHREARALLGGTSTLMLDASAWAPGTYVVRATADGASVAARVVRR
jgi:hypothetical protein